VKIRETGLIAAVFSSCQPFWFLAMHVSRGHPHGPFDPTDRSQAGHWEGDLIVGKNQRSAIGTLVERQTRMIRLIHLPTRDADTLRIAISTTMSGLPTTSIRSLTWDQGIEMARHTDITADCRRRRGCQINGGSDLGIG
jgi:IS30 family transposase